MSACELEKINFGFKTEALRLITQFQLEKRFSCFFESAIATLGFSDPSYRSVLSKLEFFIKMRAAFLAPILP